jgi:hypothetical protein
VLVLGSCVLGEEEEEGGLEGFVFCFVLLCGGGEGGRWRLLREVDR